MLVSLIKKERIYSITLPLAVDGTYWVTDRDKNGNERKLVSIEDRDGKWVLRSNNDNKVIEEDRIISLIEYIDSTLFRQMLYVESNLYKKSDIREKL